MNNAQTLNAAVLRNGKRGPVTITFRTARRDDPATPYIATDEYDQDYERKPGRKRNRSATLVIPASPRYDEPIAAYNAALRFHTVQELDALMEQLAQLRPRLDETFPADLDDTAFIIDGEHLVCPHCGAKDTIVGTQSTTRRVAVSASTVSVSTVLIAEPTGGATDDGRHHFLFDELTCSKCGRAVYLPDDITYLNK
ncbi:hypothetical protein ABZ897_16150 [Nonomuraea sp. NPDC046802]|uniref:hypothetical protein n=1 Tax=Nonomuraea sp. NPDC046802 TaxID=3154919 RepID=UPI0033FCFAC6